MTRRSLALLCWLSALPIGCESRRNSPPGSGGEAPRSAAVEAAAASAGAGPAARVSESIDELARFVQLPVRPASVLWQRGVMGKNETPEIPGPSDGFLLAVLSYPSADADRLVAAQSGPAEPSELATAPWFPAALRALAHLNADRIEVLSGARYVASSYVPPPFGSGGLMRVGTSGWFVLVLSTS